MSPNLHRLIGRAFSDEALREKLLTNPKAILAGFNLSREESNMLMAGLGKASANGSLTEINKALGSQLAHW